MLRKSSKSVGYFNGHGAIALNNPSHICQQKEEKFRELEKNHKCLQQFIKLFLVLLFLMPQLKTKAQAQAPKVHWRRFDWAKQNPTILNSSASGQTFTRSESGSDWWYDLKNSFDPGATEDYPSANMVHNGFILSGYSNIRNYVEAESSDGCNLTQIPQPLNCSYYEDGSDPTTPSWYHTVAKLKPDGRDLDWFHFLPANGNGYRVTQLIDGSYIVVGDSKSTTKFSGGFIPYNPHMVSGNPVYEGFCSFFTSLPMNPENHNIIHAQFIGVTHIAANGDILWTYNYGFYDYSDFDKLKYSSADAWDVKQLPSGNIIVVGTAGYNELGQVQSPLTPLPAWSDAFAFRIDVDGTLISKRLLHINEPTNVSEPGTYNGAIGRTLICKNINGIEKIIVGTKVNMPINNFPSRTRVNLSQFDADLNVNNLNSANGDDWHLWLHDIQNMPISGSYDQQSVFSIINLNSSSNLNKYAIGMLNNCGYCDGAGNQKGEITALILEEENGIPVISNLVNCGDGNAFDLRVGLGKNIFTNDGGFGLVSSKDNSSFGIRPPFNCNVIGANISTLDYFDADTYIAAFDANGNLKWENTYKDEMTESAPMLPPGNYKKQECMYSIVQTDDGGYMAAGNQSNNFDDNYLIKLFPENCADAITDYDITPNSLGGVPQYYEHPAYVIKHPFGNFNIFSELWNTSKKVKGTVVIPAGYELIISGLNTVISFDDSKQTGKDSKIVVLPGGKLRIENGARLTSDGNCVKGLWDGIEVWGANNLPQDLQTINLDANRPNELMSLNQGFVEIIGGSTIENAMKGITAFNLEDFNAGDTYYNGGIIHAEDAKFINNRNDIDIAWYHNFNPATNAESNNKSFFKRCNFETNAPLANPGAVNEMICDMQLHLLYTDAHLHLWNVKGVSIEGCNFNTILPVVGGLQPNYSKGIEAFDASFTCTVSGTTRNTFTNLKYGILNGSYNGSCDPAQYNTLNAPIAKIDRSDFNNCMRGIELDGTILTSINRCNFDINYDYGYTFNSSYNYGDDNMPLYGVKANTPVGIYTNAALAYTIKDNNFTNLMNNQQSLIYGMVNTNTSAFNDGLTSYNTYENLYVHQQFEESNIRLKTNCNKHTNSAFIEHYKWSVFDQLGPQGDCNSVQSSETNEFNNNSYGGNYRDIHLDNSASIFAYYANPNFVPVYENLGAGLHVCINIPPGTFNDACPTNTYPGIIAHHHDSYAKLLKDYNDLKKLIDKDDTEALLQYIEDNNITILKNLPGDAKNLLSDETLMALIDRLPPSDWSDFETILINNSPLNPRLLLLINKSSIIPNPIKQNISNAQTGVSLRSVIDNQLLSIEAEKGIALNELVAAFIDSAFVDSALAILSKDGSIGAKMLGLALDPYTHFGYNYAAALTRDFALLYRLGNNAESITQLKDYLSYYTQIINTTAQLDSLNASGEVALNNLASVTTIDGIYAAVALSATNKATYGYNPKPIHIVNGYRESPPEDAKPSSNLITINSSFNFTIQPNPANDIVKLVFENELPTLIEITDLTGKLLFRKSVQNSNNITINLFEFATGFYLVKAFNGVNESKIEKLVILK